MSMTTSIILTINNRSPEVSKRVAESLKLPGNEADEVIVVLDRPTKEVREDTIGTYLSLGATFINVEGEPGWKGPARSWNRGFDAAGGDLFYCISSEVVQDAGNVEKAREIILGGAGTLSCFASKRRVVFGACHNSEPVNLVTGAEPGVLVSSKMPRPLGFIACMPAWAVKQIGGFDEGFMDGYWYDDDDFYIRLWRTGVDFVFDDSIHGTHIHHERPVLETVAGKVGIGINQTLMLKKHGSLRPYMNRKSESPHEGRLIWRHT